MLTSESVTEGHPDKICDQVSDAVLDGMLGQDPAARVACETAITKGLCVVIGEVTTHAELDIQRTIRETIRSIGYNDEQIGFDADHALIQVYLKEQSPDIAAGVNHSLEERGGATGQDPFELQGAGDQGMMIGFACKETPELMPLTISLANRLAKKLAEVRKNGSLPFLRPDGKTQVTVEYSLGKPRRIEAVVVSTHHAASATQKEIADGVRELVINPVLKGQVVDAATKIMVNPSGSFVLGGPAADAGLTGRKIIVDTYGGVARHGGGAFSGKDPSKVDRSAAYAARHVAKNLVAAGLAERCEVQVSYAIGRAHPTSIAVETFGTGSKSEEELLGLIRRHFDLRPGAIIANMDLLRPIYRPTAAYGHFGRDDLGVPWEMTNKVDALRADATVAARQS
ncbi:MAG: methionine adenosyltransferase [Chloroflexi bacterium 13_1_40CM_4_65_16]|nr:MAG: methionine adenosyltransferase [Chloroflexi bacterium 13_1_40CM_66_19]OLC46917.1 MAG: methionine adenosyltransferase [Chloroflexi bacterium 13_1_40CM_4_65_16]OLD04856.1 MAG: methionine adenosyltransferase [Actinobacteria bacterium 13_1_40CM_3_66_19]OLE72359.1 MAG: methionine adenosyltransferase [Actinobacteria bacterium 13_1_20CM_2_66_18]TMF86415.1 MAG: methionine adenosyltransferase [Chloroflexota bacterium]